MASEAVDTAKKIAIDGARKVFDKRFTADNPDIEVLRVFTYDALQAAVDYAIREYHASLTDEAERERDRWCERTTFGARRSGVNRAGYAGLWLRALLEEDPPHGG